MYYVVLNTCDIDIKQLKQSSKATLFIFGSDPMLKGKIYFSQIT